MTPCPVAGCERIVKPGWALCDEHAEQMDARWERIITSDEPYPTA